MMRDRWPWTWATAASRAVSVVLPVPTPREATVMTFMGRAASHLYGCAQPRAYMVNERLRDAGWPRLRGRVMLFRHTDTSRGKTDADQPEDQGPHLQQIGRAHV